MDWFRGLRAATALCAPMVLGDLAGIPNLGWAALGGFEAIIADTGGPYRTRMRSLVTLSLGGAAGLALGSMVGGNLGWRCRSRCCGAFCGATWRCLASRSVRPES